MPGRVRKFIWYLEVIPRLGVGNVLYVLFYRQLLKSGLLKKKFRTGKLAVSGEVFSSCSAVPDFPTEWEEGLLNQAEGIVNGRLPYYSYHVIEQSSPPNWFLNPFNGKECKETRLHWTQISDFNQELGDIKNVWEASRFTWLGILARAHAVSGKKVYLDTLNHWLKDWIEKNPVNQGPNWKCGQETSYRVFSLLNAANILEQVEKPSEILKELIYSHLLRIRGNLRYALAQRNNHATSEAAALYIGANWLARVSETHRKEAEAYANKGWKILESLVNKLSYEDGSFAQHSVVYHRLFLDTLSLAVFWSRKLVLKDFSPGFYQAAKKSSDWLYALCDESGDCPNLGPNDGTLLQSNHSCDYRDFRPALQVASVFLQGTPLADHGPFNEALYWFGIKKYPVLKEKAERNSQLFQSGYMIMRGEDSWALLRYPFYRFRPAHNDALHFDLWANGSNLLFDSGSYSYNPEPGSVVPDLKSVHAHNTVAFDGAEQMPRLGRFLLGKWLKPLQLGEALSSADSTGSWEASYRDAFGNVHLRRISWSGKQWEIWDRFSGSASQVEIGFNFALCEFNLDQAKQYLSLPWGTISVSSASELSVKEHMYSQYYLQYKEGKRLVITANNNSELLTTINIH